MKKIILCKVLLLFGFFLGITTYSYSQDFDGDGILDSVDLDDDNDGILDNVENNILSYGGFENVPVPKNGNNQAGQGVNANTILPWIVIPGGLGSGGTPNVVQVDGDVYNYGNGGPPFDANPSTNMVGFKQHYFDLNGNADIYQSFTIGTTTTITYSGYFSPRDNNNTATGKIAIYLGQGNNLTGATLIDDSGTVSIPIQNGSSKNTPWTLVQATTTLSPGTYSFVITMSNYSNFDEGSVTVANSSLDTDGDGIANIFDLDSDNDGIFDAEEAGHGQSHTNGVVSHVVGTDGIPDAVQSSRNSGTVNYVVAESSVDSDYILNFLDIDSDGDGIPDNVEAQPTIGYVPPSNVSAHITDVNNNGVDDAYESAMGGTDITQLIDTDGDGIKDYLDSDSDNDGTPDIEENGQANTVTNIDLDNDGLDDNFDTIISHWDVNDKVSTGDILDLISTFGDSDSDIDYHGDLDYRDNIDFFIEDATLYFDGGDDYVSIPDLQMSGWADVTVMAWVKLDPNFSQDGDVLGQNMFRIWIDSSSKVNGYLITNNNNTPYNLTSSTSLVKNEWHHLTLSYQGTSGILKLYVDGEVEVEASLPKGALSTEFTFTDPDFSIGRFERFANSYFTGNIDEVRVFNKYITDTQIQQMVYQEIENDNNQVKGIVLPKDVEDISSGAKVAWSDLKAYYPMTEIANSKVNDFSGNGNIAILHNINRVEPQTAPLPYKTGSNGAWNNASTWLHGDVWDIEDAQNNKDWCIVKIENDVTVAQTIKSAGLIIDADKSLTVQGDHLVKNNWYLELNGTLDLEGDSQLIQTIHSDLVTSASGKILRRQEGVASSYWYNYWGSPVGATSVSALTNNNTIANNTNNTNFRLELLKDSAGFPVQFTSSYSQTGYISTSWLYTFINGVTYWDWAKLSKTTNIKPGVGYTQKGTGSGGTDEQYIFEGKPNNGTILINVTDKGGAGSVASVSATNYLFGNPYPSALNIHKFIDDNQGVISGKIQVWQQWAGSSHYLSDYEGGYATINKSGSVRAYQFVGFYGSNNGSQNGTKTPTRYLPVGQGFMAEIIADGHVEFNNTQRVFIKEADANGFYDNGSVFFKSSNAKTKEGSTNENEQEMIPMQRMRLEFNAVVGPKTRRELLLAFSEVTTDAYDYGYDSENGDNNNNDLNLNLEGKNMSIQAYSPISDDKVIPLNFKSSGNNTFEIKITELENIDSTQEIYLKDNVTGEYFDLTQETPYTFSSNQGKFNNRFEIVFQSEQKSLSTEESTITENFMYYQNTTHTFYAKKLNANVKNFALINIRGQRIMELENVSMSSLENGIRFDNMATGTYIVYLRTDANEVLNKKIIIN